ncbi:MAG: sugar transferase [Planctomycetota bacterium]|jgi:lipopolysaccharide/colanic/teichoic acid biosynthesis glycosyltransferase
MTTRKSKSAERDVGSRAGEPADTDVTSAIRRDGPNSTRPIGLLSQAEFEWFLERERSLADRGNRFFTLLIVQPKEPQRQSLEQLAVQLRERLRRTDLIGFVEGSSLGVLLADTRPEGSKTVASWVDQAVRKLRLTVDAKIYVYPSVDEAIGAGSEAAENGNRRKRSKAPPDEEDDEPGHDGGAGPAVRTSDNGAPSDGRVSPPDDDVACIAATAPASHAPWPMEDLWKQLSIPLPLWKRTLDVVLSGLALVLLSPLFVVLVILIRLDSSGPALFRQKRAGHGGQPFTMYKFRSMVVDAEQHRCELAAMNEQTGPVFKIRHDPRITRIGRLLRRWSLDELPQIWNVFKGDISLVGPRSPTFDELAEYERWQRRRLSVTGGMTCIWQVSGRSQVGFREWMRMDMAYVARRGPWLDLKLLGKTVAAILSGRGAY